ncbi:FAD-dependent oxidoreductase [Pediococcus pentosaceus]|uniref:FAD-dependent oxidoreductase n=1 Tax=Pediococcus pentosaceus TaxID=1255 RepID=UPI002DE9CEE8|nr:FAD-dependent oxidoreductase [Pediococcus pentosaceus]MEC5140516.1 FAD-dependent oxidoreductase [Pediococcus pentosaceus]
MKVAIIGCTHAGTAAVREILRQNPDTEVDIYERNNNISFLSCGIALYLNGRVKRLEDMMYDDAEDLRSEKIRVNLRHDVLKIDRNQKEILVQNMEDYSIRREHYDKLVMCTGSAVTLPPIKGINHKRVMLCKNYEQAQTLHQVLKPHQRVALIGGGYVNAELAESLSDLGCQVTLYHSHDVILNNYVDVQLSKMLVEILEDHGVKVKLNSKVTSFTDQKDSLLVTTIHDQNEEVDVAIVSKGFIPVTNLLEGQVKMSRNGAILTNEYGQTSDPDIYAAGDARTVHYNPTDTDSYIPLATNAIRQGKLVGINIFGNRWPEIGSQGTSGLQLFGYTLATTGLTYQRALDAGLKVKYISYEDNYRPEFMPTTEKINSIIVYEQDSLKVLGAQFFSEHNVSQLANTMSLAIQNQNTLKDLAFVDMLFQPYYDRPFNFINLVAQAGLQQEGLI